jgi:hypothetical protein
MTAEPAAPTAYGYPLLIKRLLETSGCRPSRSSTRSTTPRMT